MDCGNALTVDQHSRIFVCESPTAAGYDSDSSVSSCGSIESTNSLYSPSPPNCDNKLYDSDTAENAVQGDGFVLCPQSKRHVVLNSSLEAREYKVNDGLTRLARKPVIDASEFGSLSAFANSRVVEGIETGSFLCTNLNCIVDQFKLWKDELPMVEPFYAVKCNPDVVIVKLLASMGCSFDCATMGEINLVLNGLGDDLSFNKSGRAEKSIVYANPAKMEHMLQFAIDNNVKMTVFDGVDELHKIASLPGGNKMDLLLRLTTDDSASICRFSKKFGCPVSESRDLLIAAKGLGLRVSGVSFHVGSGCGDADAYTTALAHARRVFDAADELGMEKMTIIDVGGGFPGDTGGYGGPGMPTFQQLAQSVRKGIKASFTVEEESKDGDKPTTAASDALSYRKLRFIAEPGRFFVSASTAIVTKVYARKGGNENYQALYVDDGVYGSFNNVVYDHASPVPQRLAEAAKATKADSSEGKSSTDSLMPTAVFGPTCDGLDQICSLDSTTLGKCAVGDWLIFENQGAYTHTASFVFNGYTHIPNRIHVIL